MLIQRIYKKGKNKVYFSVVLMENIRECKKIKHKIIANLSKFPKGLLAKLESVLKGNLITDLSELKHKMGKSYGGIFVIKK